MGGWRRVDFMFQIWFLNLFQHPVICYEFLNTLYSIVKPASDFFILCSAPLHGHGAERRNYGTECYAFTEDVKHAAFWCGIWSIKCFPLRDGIFAAEFLH